MRRGRNNNNSCDKITNFINNVSDSDCNQQEYKERDYNRAANRKERINNTSNKPKYSRSRRYDDQQQYHNNNSYKSSTDEIEEKQNMKFMLSEENIAKMNEDQKNKLLSFFFEGLKEQSDDMAYIQTKYRNEMIKLKRLYTSFFALSFSIYVYNVSTNNIIKTIALVLIVIHLGITLMNLDLSFFRMYINDTLNLFLGRRTHYRR